MDNYCSGRIRYWKCLFRLLLLDGSDMVVCLIRLGAVGCCVEVVSSSATGFAGTFNGYSRKEHCSLHSRARLLAVGGPGPDLSSSQVHVFAFSFPYLLIVD